MSAIWDLLVKIGHLVVLLSESPIFWVPGVVGTFLLALVGLDRVLGWLVNWDRFREE